MDISMVLYDLGESTKFGYFKYSYLFLNFIDTRIKDDIGLINKSIIFNNLSIYKLIRNKMVALKNDDYHLIAAIRNESLNIFNYILTFGMKISENGIHECLIESINNQPEFFEYVINKFGSQRFIQDFQININSFIELLSIACLNNSFEKVKFLTNFLLKQYPNLDFTNQFIIAVWKESYEIYKYFIDQKVFINLNILLSQPSKLKSINVDVFCQLIQSVEPEMKNIVISNFLPHSLTSHNKDLVDYLLSQDISYENALFDSILNQDVEIVKIVIKHNKKLSFINQMSENGTPLYYAVSLGNKEIVEYLLSVPGINPNLHKQSNQTPLILAITNFDMDIIDLLLDFYGDEIQSQMWQINESLEQILEKFLINNVKKNSKNYISFLNVIQKLLKIKNLDLNYHAQKRSIITYAIENNDIVLTNMIIESENVDINLHSQNDGNTPLMTAIEDKKIDIAKLFIESSKFDINLRNYKNETALTIAVKMKLPEIVLILINDKKFDPIESRLNYAFIISDNVIAQQLLSIPKLDVNFRMISSIQGNNQLETPLIYAVGINDIEKVRLIINHKSFDKIKSQVETSILTAVKLNELEIFKELLPLIDNDVNISFESESLLIHAVKYQSDSIVSEILENDKFDSMKSNLLTAFICTFNSNEALISSMILLYEYDSQHDHLIDFSQMLTDGKSYLTTISPDLSNVDVVVEFLISNGADPDQPDRNGIYPLQYAIKTNSYQFVSSLIESGKINLNRRFKDTIKNDFCEEESFFNIRNDLTYLHLAAKQNGVNIFNKLMNLNIIDVNSVDNFGETPLFIAFRFLNRRLIKSLFNLDNLNYKLKNKAGYDVLSFAYKKLQKYFICKPRTIYPVIPDQINTKVEYASKLFEIIDYKQRYKRSIGMTNLFFDHS